MKVILSRKGFDSSIQGGGSANFVHNNDIFLLPIPEVGTGIKYEDLIFNEKHSLLKVMRDLNINQFTESHFDPYISNKMLNKDSTVRQWKKSLGQCDIAQNILKAEEIKKGDLFIFFAWFNQIVFKDGKYKYSPFSGHHKEGVQMLYGYMQIDETIDVNRTDIPLPEWVKTHPHYMYRDRYRGENIIYTGKEKLSFDTSKPGAGIFKYDKDLILTESNKTRTNWILPKEFHPDNNIEIKYLPKKNWKPSKNGNVRIKASSRGQEFVVIKDEKTAIEDWAKNLINTHEIDD